MAWDYGRTPKESIEFCNCCGRFKKLLDQPQDVQYDRYGHPVTVWTCPSCGLIYLSPRMTAAASTEFYATGAYRDLILAHTGETSAMRQAAQWAYAESLFERLAPHLAERVRVLDVGGSNGLVLKRFRDDRVDRGIGQWFYGELLDPAVDEILSEGGTGHANTTTAGTIEEARLDLRPNDFDLVLCCQTVDHFTDIAEAIRLMAVTLRPSGHLWIDWVDCTGFYEVKIDHPFYLTSATMHRYVDAEFTTVVEGHWDGYHGGLLLERKADL